MLMQFFSVDNTIISDANSDGIYVTYQTSTDSVCVRNNKISNIGLFPGMLANSNTGNGVLILNKNNANVEYNSVINNFRLKRKVSFESKIFKRVEF